MRRYVRLKNNDKIIDTSQYKIKEDEVTCIVMSNDKERIVFHQKDIDLTSDNIYDFIKLP